MGKPPGKELPGEKAGEDTWEEGRGNHLGRRHGKPPGKKEWGSNLGRRYGKAIREEGKGNHLEITHGEAIWEEGMGIPSVKKAGGRNLGIIQGRPPGKKPPGEKAGEAT